MKKIVLFCGAGMSSSLLVLKVRNAVKEAGLDYVVEGYDTSTVIKNSNDAAVVLVAPQVRHKTVGVIGYGNIGSRVGEFRIINLG